MVEEVWKDVVGFEDYFKISSFGNLFSKRTNKCLKKHKHPHGYLHVATKIGGRKGKNVCFKLHRLVADAFLDGKLEGYVVNHLNGIKYDNRVENLEWCSHKENYDHAVKIGLISKN